MAKQKRVSVNSCFPFLSRLLENKIKFWSEMVKTIFLNVNKLKNGVDSRKKQKFDLNSPFQCADNYLGYYSCEGP